MSKRAEKIKQKIKAEGKVKLGKYALRLAE
jgi:hypothetical protein